MRPAFLCGGQVRVLYDRLEGLLSVGRGGAVRPVYDLKRGASGREAAAGGAARLFDWLYDLEYVKLGLPRPDLVIFLDVDLKTSEARMRHRQQKTGKSGDIHERDTEYLQQCLDTGHSAAKHYGWRVVDFMKDGFERAVDEKHEEIFSIIKELL